MSKAMVVIGFGPGISSAVAERFGAEGFSVALVARNPKRLAEGSPRIFDPAVKGLLSAVQEALPDLRNSQKAAVLVTNGMSGDISDAVDAFVALRNVYGLGLANATKSKLVGLLAQRLKSEGVYVGQVTIAGLVKGSRPGMEDGIKTSAIADKFWEIFQARTETRVRVG